MVNDILEFSDREGFRAWLAENAAESNGVWLLFGKKGGPHTVSAKEALEEALCFGWIDGQMKSIDDTSYRKYFSSRRANSKWSEKNKALSQQLEQQGKMTDRGRSKIDEAKENNRWDAPKPPAITDEDKALLSKLIEAHEPAHSNFKSMPPSVQKTYTKAYLDAKTEAGREKRLAWIISRLDKNLKPM